MHVIVRRMVRIRGTKSTAVVQCSCGEKFKAKTGEQAEREQFQHMISKDGGKDGEVPF